jgi:GNAT superfamily N-acetyltransferase
VSTPRENGIRVRPAERKDAKLIAGFQVAMARETEKLELDPPTVRLGVAAVFDDPRKGRYWLAEFDGQVAGSLLTIAEWSDWRNGAVLWIHSVYIRPEFRRRGVFRALYTHLRKMVLAEEALKGLRLYVDRRNRCAQQTYAALGMDGEHYQMYEWMK